MDRSANGGTEHQVERTLRLDAVSGQGAAVLELLVREDEALLVGRDALLELDLGLDVVDGVAELHLKGDGLASQGLDEDLVEDLVDTVGALHQEQCALGLDVVIGQGAAVLELPAREEEALMVGRDALLELDLGLDVVDGVAELYLKGQGDGLYLTEPQGLDEDLVDMWFGARHVDRPPRVPEAAPNPPRRVHEAALV